MASALPDSALAELLFALQLTRADLMVMQEHGMMLPFTNPTAYLVRLE